MNNKKDGLGTISFVDVDINSRKMAPKEFIPNSSELPEVASDVQTKENSMPLTQEQEEILNGTYKEKEAERQKARQDAKIKAEASLFRTVALIIMTVVVCFYGFGLYLHSENIKKQALIKEKITFLTNNATYNNNVRAIFTNLRNNAAEYQSSVRSSTIYKSKSKEYIKEIEDEQDSLASNEDMFKTYGAEKLYKNLKERLDEALALANYQKENSEVVDVILKTNAYITAEESSKEAYLGILEDYLRNSEIPYKYEDGKLNYKVD